MHYQQSPGPESRVVQQPVGWYLQQQRPWDERAIPIYFNLTGLVQGLLFILCMFASNWQFAELSSNPLVGFNAELLQKYGATDTSAIRDNHQWWRIISSMYVSSGLVQLWAALLLQWTFGSFLSRVLGLGAVLCIHLGGGVGSVLVSANFASKSISAATTGPGMALLGASCCELIFHRRRYRHHWITALVVGYVLGLLLFMGATPFVDNWCHLAGLLLGAIICCSALIVRSRERDSAKGELAATSAAVALAALAVVIIASSAAAIQAPVSAGASCSWCAELVCAKSTFWDCEAATVYPRNCAFNAFRNGTTSITCPKGDVHLLQTNQTSQALLETLCSQYCSIQLPIGATGSIGAGGGGNTSTLYRL